MSVEELKAHSSLLLTRATSSCFPKHWSVEALKSRDLLKTLLCITLTNNLYFHNRSIFLIYRTFSLALLKWSKAQGLIKTPKTFTDGFWKASSGHKPPCRNVKKAMLQSMQQQRWENTTDETNADQCVHSTKPYCFHNNLMKCRGNILLSGTSHNYLIFTFSQGEQIPRDIGGTSLILPFVSPQSPLSQVLQRRFQAWPLCGIFYSKDELLREDSHAHHLFHPQVLLQLQNHHLLLIHSLLKCQHA